MLLWACARLSRFPGTLRSFSKPLFPRISLHSLFFLLSCFLLPSTVDFHPRWQQLVPLAANIFQEHPSPWGHCKTGETKASSLWCFFRELTRHVKTSVIPWEQGFLYSLQYHAFILGIQIAILKNTMCVCVWGKAKLKYYRFSYYVLVAFWLNV